MPGISRRNKGFIPKKLPTFWRGGVRAGVGPLTGSCVRWGVAQGIIYPGLGHPHLRLKPSFSAARRLVEVTASTVEVVRSRDAFAEFAASNAYRMQFVGLHIYVPALLRHARQEVPRRRPRVRVR